ncbi:MAG TPA: hypothetical protein VGQ14_00465 [Candidatus Eisenbacteria bacterium]|nr:hypothetical protein [Candidatus Eisenbacteria bacterium]
MSHARPSSTALFRAAVTYGMVALCLSGCATRVPVEKEHLASAMERRPQRVRVATSGSTLELAKPALSGDTLRGRVDERDTALPISAVDSLWIRRNNRKTARIVAITTVAIAAAFALAAASTSKAVH